MKYLFSITLFCLAGSSVFAQTDNKSSEKDFQQQMQEMQQQLMEQFQKLGLDNMSFSFPDNLWDSTYSFHLDTFIDGERMGSHFFFSPFGQDSSFFKGLFDDDSFFKGFQPFGDGSGWTFPPDFGQWNDENSAIEAPDDGLLPEERLRKQENQSPDSDNKIDQEAPKKPKIKTIRI
ncbi:MAG: hypothetical protein R3A50_15105 [Saprospiraceae bacterium]|nr:hypothetical protein [Saprospiraceae bacterium]MCB9344350.1 hypothetical protein [Lewinellaceae bacterium]